MTSIKLVKGFSLIEVIIASGLFALTFTAGLKLYQQIYGQWQQLNTVQQARHQLKSAQVDLHIDVNTKEGTYNTITSTYPTHAAKTVTLVQIAEPLAKFIKSDTESNEEETLDETQTLTVKERPENHTITQQLTFVIAPPYQSSWQDVVNMGPLVSLSPTKP